MSRMSGKCRYKVRRGMLTVGPCGRPSMPGDPRGYCEQHASEAAAQAAPRRRSKESKR